jgi:hypothetical protein
MSKIIAASIDLTKLDKSRIIPGKNGAEYYDISIILNDQPNQYGQDASITTGQTKEERAAKVKASYIGNGKTVYDSNNTPF